MILRPFKKIREQERRIEELSEEIRKYKRKEEDRQRKEKEGNHKMGVWCNGCNNLMQEKTYSPYMCSGEYKVKFCKLDCECEDRSEE